MVTDVMFDRVEDGVKALQDESNCTWDLYHTDRMKQAALLLLKLVFKHGAIPLDQVDEYFGLSNQLEGT